ncbi:ankyrin repeat domain-containing protein [Microbulbifer sp. ANSA005]|uniref:ankyrin repeat domain-containing protein n=1 Tax=Microbulbifer sp. ANSA005 TaxID=3243362 RepID=UPI00404225E0
MRDIETILREIENVPDFMGHNITDVTYRNGYGDTPLHIASNWGDCEAIELLVSAGADINAIGETGYTPLHCAAEQNWPRAVAKLLELGAKILEDKDGLTPLELAVLARSKDAEDALSKTT